MMGGVILATERLNQITQIDERNLQATVQPAVITQTFQDAVEEKGFYYPVDPASRGSCFIGGNLAECSGGMRAVKYGITTKAQLAVPSVKKPAKVAARPGSKMPTQVAYAQERNIAIRAGAVFAQAR